MTMYRQITDEQQFILEAASGTLERHDTVAAARAALDGQAAPDLWPLAVEAGWAGILSGADADGASLGPYEATLVLEACGQRLADARLLGHLSAVAVLEAAGARLEVRTEVAAGTRAALVDAELGTAGAITLQRQGDALVGDGTVDGVLDAPGASILVVRGADDRFGYVRQDAPGVGVTPERSYDSTRELGSVMLTAAELTSLDVEQPQLGRDLQRALVAAEAVGAADACLTMARTYAGERIVFGRTIGSYQAIKHKLVEMLRLIEGARSVVATAGDNGASANAARVLADGALAYAAAENIFVHGAVGATWEHDAPLYYRRAEGSRRLAGGPDAAARVVARALLATAGAA
jgi:alkylation response protein AidB-like acyl-CoA dehydrogenase